MLYRTTKELAAFAAALEAQGRGTATAVKYRREAETFLLWLGDRELTAAEAAAYREHLAATRRPPGQRGGVRPESLRSPSWAGRTAASGGCPSSESSAGMRPESSPPGSTSGSWPPPKETSGSGCSWPWRPSAPPASGCRSFDFSPWRRCAPGRQSSPQGQRPGRSISPGSSGGGCWDYAKRQRIAAGAIFVTKGESPWTGPTSGGR